MRRTSYLISCSLSGFLWACSGGSTEPITALPRQLTVGEQQLIATGNQFAFSFFREVVRQGNPDRNVFVSPLSAAMALGMTYNGARGETQTAMAQTLGLDRLTTQEANASFQSLIALLRGLDPKVDFRLANSIWYRQDLVPRPEFLDLNRQYFDAQVNALDFGRPDAVATINGWVNDNTNGKIPKIIDGIDSSIVMLLINAIYFKGAWVYQFDKDQTRSEPFTLRGGAPRDVSMMHRGAAPVRYYQGQGFRAVDLPYGTGAFSMTILLPDADRDVDSLTAGLSLEGWEAVVNGLADDSVAVAMPKFTLEWGDSLNGVLKALGMGVAFKPYQADLSGIAGDPGDLYISYVKQGTFVDVNEEGTEAAAVTTVGVGLTCLCGPLEFRVDRPFVFLIRERFSGTILFMGKIVNPA